MTAGKALEGPQPVVEFVPLPAVQPSFDQLELKLASEETVPSKGSLIARPRSWGEKLPAAVVKVAEAYRGVRPAPGYPACPDHTAKGALFRLLDAERNADMRLTDAFAMLPAAAVSDFYLSHPDSTYFAVGKVARDQVEDFARRAGMSVPEAEKWLAPYLDYEPAMATTL